ncbi:MAG: PEP-CTERM sorting domain-containing protein [Verrucomicrobiota bacterium]|nr:PEP-CTERM sorting domain-containing protein [Verrucomicrobiota bacterium]
MNMDGSQPVGNGLQSADGGVTWNPTLDNTGAGPQVALPILVNGTVVPEPSAGALAVLGMAALAGGAFLRRRLA